MNADLLPPSRSVEEYLDAAQRENTLRSYASAIRHFEETWGGLLPANAAQIARYLAAYAGILSLNTLKHRLAALAQWHKDHGFADPTQAARVKQTLKGIQAVHPGQEKRASPPQLIDPGRVCQWLDEATQAAEDRTDAPDIPRLANTDSISRALNPTATESGGKSPNPKNVSLLPNALWNVRRLAVYVESHVGADPADFMPVRLADIRQWVKASIDRSMCNTSPSGCQSY